MLLLLAHRGAPAAAAVGPAAPQRQPAGHRALGLEGGQVVLRLARRRLAPVWTHNKLSLSPHTRGCRGEETQSATARGGGFGDRGSSGCLPSSLASLPPSPALLLLFWAGVAAASPACWPGTPAPLPTGTAEEELEAEEATAAATAEDEEAAECLLLLLWTPPAPWPPGAPAWWLAECLDGLRWLLAAGLLLE